MTDFKMPTAEELQGTIDAGDVDLVKQLHETVKKYVNILKREMSELTSAQHELERQMIDVKDAKNKQAVMIREHQLAADTLYSAMFDAINVRKEMNILARR